MVLKFNIELINKAGISGWIWNDEQPTETIRVDVLADGAPIATVTANLFRKDLLDAGIGNGRHSLAYFFPTIFDGSKRISLRIAGLEDVFFEKLVFFSGRYPPHPSDLLRFRPWMIEKITPEDGGFTIEGWSLTPQRIGAEEAAFFLDGRELSYVEFPLVRQHIGDLFWYLDGAEKSGFRIRMPKVHVEAAKEVCAELSFGLRTTGQPFYLHHNYYIKFEELISPKGLPDRSSIDRVVSTSTTVEIFLTEGFSSFWKMKDILLRQANVKFSDFKTILDWGCGCGRIARYASAETEADFIGVDIDAKAIRWCQKYLQGGSFITISTEPPMPLPDNSVDFIYGISVFTHLREADQFKWLEELKRICRPGGFALLSFNGATSAAFDLSRPHEMARLFRAGIDDAAEDPALSEVLEDNTYYRATFHTREYIKLNWTTYFDICDFTDAVVSNKQDVVLLRKRE